MKTHTTDFKNEIKQFGREIDSKITYEISGVSIELGKEQINSVTPHYQSNILKSTMKQLDIDSNIYIPPETVINYQFGLKVGNSYEYIDYGNYVVYEVEKQEDTRSWKITCYDKMLYAMKPYESLGITYPITIKNYLEAIGTKLGLTLKNNDFVNADKEITSELYLDGDGNSLEYTYRDVLDELAQVTASVICINENDELEVRYPQNVGEYETKEGTSLSIENVDDGSDLVFDLNGNIVQDGTPTPDSPIVIETVTGRQDIEVCGKNLTNFTTISYTQANSSTVTRTDGTYTVSNSTNQYGSVRFEQSNLRLEPNTTYTFSAKVVSTNTTGGSSVYVNASYTSNSTAVYGNKVIAGGISYITFTTPSSISNSSYIALYPREANKEAVFTDIQLEKGNQATNYEEYIGNTYEINLGKNLCNYQALNLITNSNGTTSIVNGYYNVIIDTLGVSSLYVSGDFTLLNSNTLRVGGYNVYPSTSATGTRYNITFNSAFNTNNHRYIMFCFLAKNGHTIEEIQNSFQIEKGSQQSSFSPYKTPIELCKIGNYKDFIRKGTGKNLLQLTDGTYSNNGITAVVNNGTIVLNGTASANSFITIPSNIDSIYSSLSGSYTLCSNNEQTVGSATTSGTYADVRIMGNNGVSFIWRNILGNQNASQTSTPSTYTNISLQIRTGSGLSYSNFVIEPQLEKGNQATLFEAYGFKDKWYLYKTIGKTTYVGTESWEMNTSDGYNRARITISDSLDLGQSRSSDVYCTYFKNSTTNAIGIIFRYGKQIYCYVQNGITTINEFKTWLSSNNMEVYYPLATPTTTEITDTELINQLESVRLLEGLNNVLITSSDLSTPIKMTYLKYFDTIDEEYLKDVNVNFGEKFGPVNSVVLSRSAESDNIYRNDEISIEENGLTEIKIKDNQILNGNNRDEFIDNIFNQLNDLKYYTNDFKSTGITYLDLLDIYKVKVDDNYYKCIMFNNELDVTQGLEEQVYTEMPDESETDYSKADKTDRKINQAYIIVDKQNQEITSVVQNVNTLQTIVNNQGEQVDALGTRITQTVDNITTTVTSIQEELDNGVSLVRTTSVVVNDEGLTVATDTSKTTTTMTSDKFTVRSGGKDLAFFGYDDEIGSTKAQMDNLTVTTYFVAGYHRTEKYDISGEHRTGVFYIGE